uniref:hypothetical protein n=1 Tax=Calidithermus chliarophilus TaxID=52023 RepID=UPI00048963C8
MEHDIWQPDPDPLKARLEAAFYALGQRYLIEVHQAVHRALGLPQVPRLSVAKAYRLPLPLLLLAKAQRRGLGRVGEELEQRWERSRVEWGSAVRRFVDLLSRKDGALARELAGA